MVGVIEHGVEKPIEFTTSLIIELKSSSIIHVEFLSILNDVFNSSSKIEESALLGADDAYILIHNNNLSDDSPCHRVFDCVEY